MTDKKTFGAFIKSKRTEKNYSQKDLADMLFVTEGAVSKWERGISYPDITLISDICRILEVSEHELITASNDTDGRRIKREARNFRIIKGAWFWVPTISYAVALLTCFICNLAVNRTLSWFFIVLSALICAFTFVPTVTYFFESKKLFWFIASTYLSICLLLFTCAVYTGGMNWFLTATIGILIGYELVFVPVFLSKSKLSRYRFVISLAVSCVLTLLLLLNVRIWHQFPIVPALIITVYAYAPVIICSVVCTMRFDAFLKAGICTAFASAVYYFTNNAVSMLFGFDNEPYQVDFNDWAGNLNGNVQFVVLLSLLLISAALIATGFIRVFKRKKRKN